MLEAGYDGIEINVPDDETFVVELTKVLNETNCMIVAQQWLPPLIETATDYSVRMADNLMRLAELNPHLINSHTGKDFLASKKTAVSLKRSTGFQKEQG